MILVLLLLLFILSAFFSSAETVLFSLSGAQRARIKEKSPSVDEQIGRCLSDKAVLFSTLLVGNTFVNFAASTLGYFYISTRWPSHSWVAIPVMTVLILVFGEIAPKRFALRYTEEIAPLYSKSLLFWRVLFTPFNLVLRLSSRAFAPMLLRERRALSDGELVSVIELAAESGAVSSADAEMVAGVLRLSELSANDEMTPRVDIQGYDIELDEDRRLQCLQAATHRYLPVYRRSPDAIEGIIDTETGKIEEALFVPETVTLDDLLVMFAKSYKPVAIVLDEYGGTAGMISQNDVLEVIVGPGVFGDRADEPQIVKLAANIWEIDARASLDEVNRALEISLEAEDADRISGWVQFHAGRIPHVGQEILADGCRATVLKRRRRRVTSVRLEILEHRSEGDDWAILAESDEEAGRVEDDNS